MTNWERQNQIAEIIKTEGFAKVETLAKKIFVSEATIRRDLTSMEQLGKIKKIYGGAVNIEPRISSPLLRYNAQRIEKNIIAKLAMPLLQDANCLFFDSSSTVGTLANQFSFQHKTIITIGLQTASTLSSLPDINLFVPGGQINYLTNSISGSVAIDDLKKYNIDLALISASAISPKGITETSSEQSELKKHILGHAKKTALLIDSEKFGLEDIFFTAELYHFNYIVTNKQPAKQYFSAAPEVTYIYPAPSKETI